MLKKIILPLVLLIFTQQEFYGMEEVHYNILLGNKWWEWETINNYVNRDESGDKQGKYPKLWYLWAILDNTPFQYGNSEIWKHGEAYYGLSNGIGFFPSFLNFGWLKIGIIDAHINVINLILDYSKNFILCKINNEEKIQKFIAPPIALNLCFNIHIISVKILNCIKIKLITPLALLFASEESEEGNSEEGESEENNIFPVGAKENKYSTAWYITYNSDGQISWWYALLSPRIEINISWIINYFREK